MEHSILHTGSAKGYANAGASHTKRALKGLKYILSGSPHEDIDENNYTLRQRGRMLAMSAPIATSALKTNRTNVIGLGLKINPRPDTEILGIDAESAKEWQKKVRAEFKMWADHKDRCDITGINDFYSLQQLCMYSWLASGDVFILIKRKTSRNCPYTLHLQVVEADRCSTPMEIDNTYVTVSTTEGKNPKNGNRIYDGIEVDDDGTVVAYWFRNTHPFEMTVGRTKWERIESFGEETGLPNVLHIMSAERPEQYRGVTILAPVIEELMQIRRYTEAELMAAVIQAFFTVFVTSEATTMQENGNPFNEVGNGTGEDDDASYDPSEYEMGSGNTVVMNPGEDVKFADPSRPTAGFDAFVKALCKQIGSALEIPTELLLKEFSASYSASRGALLEAWKSFRMYREWFARDMCKPVYEIWLSEAIARGRVNAPGFFNDPLLREAWIGCEWIGPSMGSLDPEKEAKAEILQVAHGFTTHEAAAARLNGSDWDTNMNQLEIEAEKLRKIREAGMSEIELTTDIDADKEKEGNNDNQEGEEKKDGNKEE